MSVGRLRQIGISIALGSCLALACSKEKSEEPAAAPVAPVPAPVPVATPATPPPFDTLPSVELPGNFPEDVPRYPGFRTVKAGHDSDNLTNWVAQFSTPDDPAKVYANLADGFAAQGWTTERLDVEDGIMLYANKGNRSVTYSIASAKAKGETEVSLIIVATP